MPFPNRPETEKRFTRPGSTAYDRDNSSLSSPPPPPPDRVKPGDDTRALLGDDMSASGGVGASTPGGRANAGVMMLMQGANEIQSIFPGHPLLPQLIQIVTQLSNDIPQAVSAMQQSVAPNQLLASIGRTGAASGAGQLGIAAAIPPGPSGGMTM